MMVEELAELDIVRNMPNEVFSAQGILDYFDNMYTAYEDRYGDVADVPEITVITNGVGIDIGTLLDDADSKFKIKSVRFSDSGLFWRICEIEAEYVT